ncbi:MAG: hypothetical protein JSW00_17495 [Thermoplasmata archaeon]|nr:MAG: hypothetical protein JSW00_17495 [Thermoplasmata archaeon]
MDVSPGSLANATVNGTVLCTNVDPATPIFINLTVNSTIGSAKLDKPHIVIQGSHSSEKIEISIQISGLISPYVEHVCIVSGYWEQGGTNGTVIEGRFLIIPLNFYRFNLHSENPLKEVRQGERTYFDLIIINTGNYHDDYIMDIVNREELELSNISFPSVPIISIEQGGQKILKLTVDTSSETPEGDYQILVIITSVGSENNEDESISEEYNLTLNVIKRSKGKDESDDWEMDVLFFLLILFIIAVVIIVIIMIIILIRSMRIQ